MRVFKTDSYPQAEITERSEAVLHQGPASGRLSTVRTHAVTYPCSENGHVLQCPHFHSFWETKWWITHTDTHTRAHKPRVGQENSLAVRKHSWHPNGQPVILPSATCHSTAQVPRCRLDGQPCLRSSPDVAQCRQMLLEEAAAGSRHSFSEHTNTRMWSLGTPAGEPTSTSTFQSIRYFCQRCAFLWWQATLLFKITSLKNDENSGGTWKFVVHVIIGICFQYYMQNINEFLVSINKKHSFSIHSILDF